MRVWFVQVPIYTKLIARIVIANLCLYCVPISIFIIIVIHSILFTQVCEELIINAKISYMNFVLYTYTISFKAKNRRLIMDDDPSFFVQCLLGPTAPRPRLISHSHQFLFKTDYFFIYKVMWRKVGQSASLYRIRKRRDSYRRN